jgi:3-hydroxybutyryl-CoA dehydratase
MSAVRFEDLSVGQSAQTSKTITETDIILYSGISTDINPAHLDADAAAQGPFGGRIAHGMLSAGLISAVLGNKLPGPGTIYMGQNLHFRHPVRIGDTVTARVEITELDPTHHRVTLRTECFVRSVLVIDGEALVMVPSPKAPA